MKKLLESELRSGEIVVWSEQPNPWATVPESVPQFFFGIPFSALPTFLLCMVFRAPKNDWLPIIVAVSFGLVFLLIGVLLLLSPVWEFWKGKRTVYAITNRRCIIIKAPRRVAVRSFSAGRSVGDIVDLHRIEGRRGHGDLIFHTQAHDGKRGVYYENIGFIGIRNVREIETKVRQLLFNDEMVTKT